MIWIRLLPVMPQLFILAVLHALPLLPRRDHLFGLALAREVRYGPEGRRLLRRYHLHLLPWTVSMLLIACFAPLPRAAAWVGFSLLPIIAAYRGFSAGRAELRGLALPAPSTREARLHADSGLARRLPWFLLPLALLAATAVYLHFRWDEIPARFPIHWGQNGVPNAWSTRTPLGVFGPLLMGALLIVFIVAIDTVITWGSRRAAVHPVVRIILIAVGWLVGAAFSIAGLLPLRVAPTWATVALNGAFFVFLAVVFTRHFRRGVPAPEPGAEVTPDACWHRDLFYYDPEDPALWVQKRIGLGLTLNFGNRLAWIVVAAFLLFPVGIVVLARALRS